VKLLLPVIIGVLLVSLFSLVAAVNTPFAPQAGVNQPVVIADIPLSPEDDILQPGVEIALPIVDNSNFITIFKSDPDKDFTVFLIYPVSIASFFTPAVQQKFLNKLIRCEKRITSYYGFNPPSALRVYIGTGRGAHGYVGWASSDFSQYILDNLDDENYCPSGVLSHELAHGLGPHFKGVLEEGYANFAWDNVNRLRPNSDVVCGDTSYCKHTSYQGASGYYELPYSIIHANGFPAGNRAGPIYDTGYCLWNYLNNTAGLSKVRQIFDRIEREPCDYGDCITKYILPVLGETQTRNIETKFDIPRTATRADYWDHSRPRTFIRLLNSCDEFQAAPWNWAPLPPQTPRAEINPQGGEISPPANPSSITVSKKDPDKDFTVFLSYPASKATLFTPAVQEKFLNKLIRCEKRITSYYDFNPPNNTLQVYVLTQSNPRNAGAGDGWAISSMGNDDNGYSIIVLNKLDDESDCPRGDLAVTLPIALGPRNKGMLQPGYTNVVGELTKSTSAHPEEFKCGETSYCVLADYAASYYEVEYNLISDKSLEPASGQCFWRYLNNHVGIVKVRQIFDRIEREPCDYGDCITKYILPVLGESATQTIETKFRASRRTTGSDWNAPGRTRNLIRVIARNQPGTRGCLDFRAATWNWAPLPPQTPRAEINPQGPVPGQIGNVGNQPGQEIQPQVPFSARVVGAFESISNWLKYLLSQIIKR